MWTLWDVESRYCFLKILHKSHVKWNLFSAFDTSSPAEQWTAAVQHPVTRCKLSSVLFAQGQWLDNKPCFWLWRKPERFGGNPTQTWGERTNSTQKGRLYLGIIPRTFLPWGEAASHHTAVPPSTAALGGRPRKHCSDICNNLELHHLCIVFSRGQNG